MKLFAKYFIHFFSITILLSSICIVISQVGKVKATLNLTIFLLFFFGCVNFSIIMSMYASSVAKLVNINMPYDEQIINNIEEVILTKCNRSCKTVINNSIYFSHKNKYYKWLLNDIIISINNNTIEIILPKQYEKFLLLYNY